jgi:CRP/FNR family transcriptional regulator, anaerobic regulatory protein
MDRTALPGRPTTFPVGTILFRHGDPCHALLAIDTGTVRVQLVTPSGRQVTLYRVTGDAACVLSTQCLLTGTPYPAEGVAETAIEGRLLSGNDVTQLIGHDATFRNWLFGTYGTRIADLVLLVEDLLETHIAPRLARHLIELADRAGSIGRTHQSIAAELGTAREVVSRHLKDFERRGAVALHRGEIVVLRSELLHRWAGPAV